MKLTILFCLSIATGLLFAAASRADDASVTPGLFQEKCGRCHDRAGVLVRERLDLVDETLKGRASGRDLREILPRHFGRRPNQEVEAITQALMRLARKQGRFQVRCGICHASAEEVVRHRLIIVEGELRGRYTGRDIGEFLTRHGTSSAEEAAFFEDVLRRIARSSP
jgi:hypothetical protein